jgi:hypothetical protein
VRQGFACHGLHIIVPGDDVEQMNGGRMHVEGSPKFDTKWSKFLICIDRGL